MMIVPAGVKVHLALGYTDMRKGLDGLAMLVQQTLKQDPFSGHLFAFRGKKAALLKILFWDGTGLCLFTKRMNQGQREQRSNASGVTGFRFLKDGAVARSVFPTGSSGCVPSISSTVQREQLNHLPALRRRSLRGILAP